VISILDGDTIDVLINNNVYRVRYIGVDTPESNEYYFNPATAFNQNLVFNKNVTLIKDISETDTFDRLLRYVIVGDTFVNYELTRQGFAHAAQFPPDTACADKFQNAEVAAQKDKSGMWMPTPTPYIVLSNGEGSGNCHPSYPTVCIPPPPPDLDCGDISYRSFQVLSPDPHRFDGDDDGIGCEG